MNDLFGFIEKHRSNGILIDANLLLLYAVGKTNKQRIPRFKRTEKYSIADFELRERLAAQFKTPITTPHFLTQVCDLAQLGGKERIAFNAVFQQLTDLLDERFESSRQVSRHQAFARLGLADAAIAMIARRPMLVLTEDLDLYVHLVDSGVDSINFNHIRSFLNRGA
jgi:hypothetical protein